MELLIDGIYEDTMDEKEKAEWRKTFANAYKHGLIDKIQYESGLRYVDAHV